MGAIVSASEKLKALDNLTNYPEDVLARSQAAAIRGRTLLDALPQIVAVVEAAERAVDQFDTPERYIGTPMADLRAALTALDEARGGEVFSSPPLTQAVHALELDITPGVSSSGATVAPAVSALTHDPERSDHCGDRSADAPLAVVCSLAPGHDGMHSDGSCSWAHPWEEGRE